MGFFGAIKDFFHSKKELKKSIEDTLSKEARYLQMSFDELLALSDDDLFNAVVARTEYKVDRHGSLKDGIDSLNPSQKLFYSLNWLEMEVNNGGLCQFFVNSSRLVAPCVSKYMGIIGADDHKKLFDTFISQNNIDLSDLSSFVIDDLDEYEAQTERYPFDDYDNAFYEMEPLEFYLKQYIRANLRDF